jgi:hypothetical protein
LRRSSAQHSLTQWIHFDLDGLFLIAFVKALNGEEVSLIDRKVAVTVGLVALFASGPATNSKFASCFSRFLV